MAGDLSAENAMAVCIISPTACDQIVLVDPRCAQGSRAVPDTSFFIEHFRKGTVQGSFLNLARYYHVAFSSVVLMELLAGAFDPKEQKLIDQIARNFTVLSIAEHQWFVCGEIMMKLRRDKKIDPERITRLLPDSLIAVSVRYAGAVLITKNEKDFKLIQEVYDFKYVVAD